MYQMIDKQRTAYMRIALGMAGVFENDMRVETIWRIYEELEQKQGDLALRDVAKIESQVSQKYKRKDGKTNRKMHRQTVDTVSAVYKSMDNRYENTTLSNLPLTGRNIKVKNYETPDPEKNL